MYLKVFDDEKILLRSYYKSQKAMEKRVLVVAFYESFTRFSNNKDNEFILSLIVPY